MKKNCFKGRFCAKAGFTLIELLVVVLIIGILAAVAVPQYQKAVYKSRTVEALTMLKAIANAQEVYYLANGEYTTNLGELDIDIPTELVANTWNVGNFEDRYSYMCNNKSTCGAFVENANMPFLESNLDHRQDHLELVGKKYCHIYGDTKNKTAQQICQSIGSLDTSLTESWFVGKYFLLN